MEMIRPSRDENFLEIAKCVAKRATCIRRKYGAVIVDENGIVSGALRYELTEYRELKVGGKYFPPRLFISQTAK